MAKVLSLLIVCALLLGMSGTAVQAQEETSPFVVEAVYAAVSAGDIDAALELLADDAVLTILPAPMGQEDAAFVGKEEIRAWYEALHAGNSRAEFDNVRMDGDRATWTARFWNDLFESLGIAPAEFEGVAILHDGKVQSMIWSQSAEFKAKMDARMANEEIVRQWLSHFDTVNGDLAGADELLAAGFVSHNMPAGDRAVMLADLAGFREANPNTYFTVDDLVIAGGKAFLTNQMWTIPEGAQEGVPAGPPFLTVLNLKDGKITERALYVLFEPSAQAASAETPEAAANMEIVQRYQTAWEQADLETLGAVLDETFVNHSPPLPPDREGMMEHAASFRKSFTDGKYTINQISADGDRVWVFGHFQGIHDGEPFMGIPASGAEASFDYTTLLRLQDGKLVERWATADDVMGLLVPLGYQVVAPEAAAATAEAPAQTAEEIAGVWQVEVDGTPYFLHLEDGGAMRMTDAAQTATLCAGSYAVAEGKVTIQCEALDPTGCPNTQKASYAVFITADAAGQPQLRFVLDTVEFCTDHRIVLGGKTLALVP